MSASVAAETTAEAKKPRPAGRLWPRLKGVMLALVVPLIGHATWHAYKDLVIEA
jgi:hypothetical protein